MGELALHRTIHREAPWRYYCTAMRRLGNVLNVLETSSSRTLCDFQVNFDWDVCKRQSTWHYGPPSFFFFFKLQSHTAGKFWDCTEFYNEKWDCANRPSLTVGKQLSHNLPETSIVSQKCNPSVDHEAEHHDCKSATKRSKRIIRGLDSG